MFRLSDVVQPLSDTQIETLTSKAVKRILHSEKAIAQSGMSHVRAGLCTQGRCWTKKKKSPATALFLEGRVFF